MYVVILIDVYCIRYKTEQLKKILVYLNITVTDTIYMLT